MELVDNLDLDSKVCNGREGSNPSLGTICLGDGTGRQIGLKIRCPYGREGSNPSLGTKHSNSMY